MRPERVSRKKRFRIACVYLKYLMPAISAAVVLVLCMVPTFRFSYDDTVRQAQSIFGNAVVAINTVGGVRDTAQIQDAAATLALAKNVNALVIATYASVVLMVILPSVIAIMTLWAYRYPPESSQANRVKLWFRFLVPGRWTHFAACFLPILPTLYPHILKWQYERYAAQYLENGEYKFLEITVKQTWIDPLITAAVLALISVILYIIARDWEGMYRMDMFREFSVETDPPRSRRERSTLTSRGAYLKRKSGAEDEEKKTSDADDDEDEDEDDDDDDEDDDDSYHMFS